MLDAYSGIVVMVTCLAAFVTTYVTITPLASWLKHRGIVGVDIHKLNKPKIPEMCGLAVIAGLVVASLLSSRLFGANWREAAAFLGTVLVAGVIGAIDDVKPLGSKLKPVLTALAAVPILLLGTYNPHPFLPFVGTLNLPILYPLLIPVAIAVPANAVNMLDVFNGSMSGSAAIISLALGVVLVLSGNSPAASLALALFGSLLAFYLFNRYPARVFGGDTGSLAVGAGLGALAIIARTEVVTIVALAPYIMNAFYGLASIGRLYERHEIKSRPVRLRDDGRLEATVKRKAPVTLARLILAEGPLYEQEIVRMMIMLTALSSALAVLTFLIPEVL
jgi:UDP-N-acetylmuramyl pentapeptide phosphotransferase/UDP-N-acetylglucosamine-1-phosphate transferase